MFETILGIFLITFSIAMTYKDKIKECFSWCKDKILSYCYDN